MFRMDKYMNLPRASWSLLGLFVLLATCNQSVSAVSLEPIVGGASSPGDAGDRVWQYFYANVTERSAGEIQPLMMIRGEAGHDMALLGALRRGRLQIASFSPESMAQVESVFGVFSLPYLFESDAEVDFVLDSGLNIHLAAAARRKNLILLSWVDAGWMHIYGKKPILAPADMDNYRMRSLQSPASILFMKTHGADVITIPRSDLIPALQTGLVDGGETSLVFYNTMGIASEAPHLVMTQHARSFGIMFVNKDWYDNLSPSNAEIIKTSFQSIEDQRIEARTIWEEEIISIKKLGAFIYNLSEVQLAAWRQTTRRNHEVLLDEMGSDAIVLYELIVQLKNEYRLRESLGASS